MGFGLLIARFILGLSLASHGAQKLFGWFGGYGLKGTGGFFEGLGFRPGTLFAFAAGCAELAGGLLTALGFLGAIGPALIVLVMVEAILTVHWPNGFYAQSNGLELPLMNAGAAFAIAFAGPGGISLDRAFGISGLSRPGAVWLAILVAVVLAVASLALRHKPAPTPAGSHA
jgi:putative oxidoreductase